jgi:RNA polymerase sigma-70 factor (ECF subfamily)
MAMGMETPENMSVARAQSGSEDAFAELARKHSSQIYKCSLRMLQRREGAEDSLQNVLLQALRNINSFEGKSQFSTWLVRVAINAVVFTLSGLIVPAIFTRAGSTELHSLAQGNKFAA